MHKDVITYSVGRVIPAVIGFGALLVYANMVPANIYGVYAVALALTNIVNLTFHQWLRVSFTRFYTGQKSNQRQVARLGACYFLAINLALFLSACLIVISFDIDPVRAFLVFGMVLAASTSDYVLENLRARNLSRSYSFQYCLRQVSIVTASIALFVSIKSEYSLVVGYIIGNLLSGATYARYFFRVKSAADEPISVEIKADLLSYGAPLSLNFGLSALINSGDKLIVDWFLGAEATGIYALVTDIAKQLVITTMEGVNLAAYPAAVTALANRGQDECIAQLATNLVYLMGIGVPVTFGLIFVSADLIETLFGSEYQNTSLLLSIFALATLLRGVRIFYFDQAFQLALKTGEAFKVTVWSSVALLLAAFWLTSVHGSTGAALAVLGAQALAAFLSLVCGRRYFSLPIPVRSLVIIGICSFMMWIPIEIVRLIGLSTPLQLTVSVSVGMVTYLAGVVFLDLGGLRTYMRSRHA